MKKTLIIPLLTVILTGNLLSSCDSDYVDVKPEIYSMNIEKKEIIDSKGEVATAQKSLNSDFEKFIQKANAIIDRNRLNISELNAQVEDKRFETKNKTLSIVCGMYNKNEALKERLNNYVATGSGNWKIFESELKGELHELSKTYNDVTEHIIEMNTL